MRATKLQAVENNIAHQPIPDPVWQNQLLKHCHRRSYRSQQDIIFPGTPSKTLFYVISGKAAVIAENEDGRDVVIAYLNKGDFIGEMGMFIPYATRSVTVRTREPSELAEISYTKLASLFEGELKAYAMDVLHAIGRQLSRKLEEANRRMIDLALLDVKGRIESILINLCKQPDAMTHPDGMQIRITRKEISQLVGCSREMAGRVLKKLEEEGMVRLKGKTIVVLS